MFEVYWRNWEGCEEEPEEIFDTREAAEQYIEDNDSDDCEEGYVIHDVTADRWF